MNRRAHIWLLLLTLATAGQAAAEVRFSASVDREQVGLGETLVLTLTVDSERGVNSSDVTPPDTGSLQVVGNSVTESTSFVFSGGSQSFRRLQSFHYVLQPTRLGTVRIGPAQLRYGGKTYTTEPIEIQVVRQPTRPPAPAQKQRPRFRSPGGWFDDDWEDFFRRPDILPREEIRPEDLYVRLQLSSRNVYEGQQITAQLKIFSRVGLRVSSIRWPALNDFFSVDRDVSDEEAQQVVLEGRSYLTKLLDARALFPLRAGELEIGPVEVEVELNTNPFYPAEKRLLRTRAVKITAQQLPAEGRPASFDPAHVGRFSLAAEIDSNEATLNQPITLSIKVSGKGALQRVNLPRPAALDKFRVFDSTTEVQAPKKGLEVRGTKRSEIILVPLASGQLEIPALEFSYFDPELGAYRTLQTEPITLKVGASSAQPAAGAEAQPAEVNLLAGSFQPIRFESRLEGGGPPLVRRPFFLPLLMGPPGLYLVVLLVTLFRAWEQQDSERLRRRQAWSQARRQLKQAGRHLGRDQAADFYRELTATLFAALEGATGRSWHGYPLEQICSQLSATGLEPALLEKWKAEVENCQSGRFAPLGKRGQDMEEAWKRTRRLLRQLERMAPRRSN